jgi:hypothetical protein
MRTIGGILDFYFVVGDNPEHAIQLYHNVGLTSNQNKKSNRLIEPTFVFSKAHRQAHPASV